MRYNIRMIIREYEGGDFQAFYLFFKKTLKDLFPDYTKNSIGYIVSYDYSRKFLKEQLDKKNKHLILSLDNDKLVGYLLFHRHYAGVSFANWLAVDKDNQKKGIASGLLESWEKLAVREGAHVLQLWTNIHNLDFYRKRGFVLAGKFPKAWHGLDSYLFYKALRDPKEENFLNKYLKKNK